MRESKKRKKPLKIKKNCLINMTIPCSNLWRVNTKCTVYLKSQCPNRGVDRIMTQTGNRQTNWQTGGQVECNISPKVHLITAVKPVEDFSEWFGVLIDYNIQIINEIRYRISRLLKRLKLQTGLLYIKLNRFKLPSYFLRHINGPQRWKMD